MIRVTMDTPMRDKKEFPTGVCWAMNDRSLQIFSSNTVKDMLAEIPTSRVFLVEMGEEEPARQDEGADA